MNKWDKTWKTKSGQEVSLAQMTDEHIENTIQNIEEDLSDLKQEKLERYNIKKLIVESKYE